MPKRLLISAVVLLSVACFFLRLAAQDQRSADERALRETEAAWSKASKNLEQFVSFYADDASLFEPNAPIITGKAAIRAAWADMLKNPGFSLSFKGTKAEISKSGDIAYTSGAYAMTMNDPSSKRVKDNGKYVTVYKKVGGKWKAVADIFNSDLPAAKP